MGGPSVFEPLVRGGSCNFQLPMGGHHIFNRNRYTFICQITGEISLEKERSIQPFSQGCAVGELHASPCVPYMKQKRETGRRGMQKRRVASPLRMWNGRNSLEID